MSFDGYVVMNGEGCFILNLWCCCIHWRNFNWLIIQFGGLELSEIKFLFCGKPSIGGNPVLGENLRAIVESRTWFTMELLFCGNPLIGGNLC